MLEWQVLCDTEKEKNMEIKQKTENMENRIFATKRKYSDGKMQNS